MIGVTYKVSGAKEVADDLSRFRLDAIESEVGRILDEMAAEAADYPAPPVGSTYVRTETLMRGWLESSPIFDTQATSLLAVLTNSTPYGPFVQGAEDQAAIHQGRWKTTDALMGEWEPKVTERIESALDRVLPR
jgi:hypothetical protein